MVHCDSLNAFFPLFRIRTNSIFLKFRIRMGLIKIKISEASLRRLVANTVLHIRPIWLSCFIQAECFCVGHSRIHSADSLDSLNLLTKTGQYPIHRIVKMFSPTIEKGPVEKFEILEKSNFRCSEMENISHRKNTC